MYEDLRKQRLVTLAIVIVAALLTLVAFGCGGSRPFGSWRHNHGSSPAYGDYVEYPR